MKGLLKNTIIDGFSLFLTAQTLSGVKVEGGFMTFVFGGLALSLMTSFLKPVLKIITLPINIVTFGTFSFVINIIVLYLLTVFIPQIKVSAFIFQGFSLYGFVIPKFFLNTFFAFVVVSFTLSVIISFFRWIIK